MEQSNKTIQIPYALPIPILIKKQQKTYITNMPIIAEYVKRSPNEIMMYLEYELSVPGNFNEFSLSELLTTKIIQSTLERYCKKYVECCKCHKINSFYKRKDDELDIVCNECHHIKKILDDSIFIHWIITKG
jgi:translation initiation factor 2 beta subunit (eIF-2beta)/eIF-5